MKPKKRMDKFLAKCLASEIRL